MTQFHFEGACMFVLKGMMNFFPLTCIIVYTVYKAISIQFYNCVTIKYLVLYFIATMHSLTLTLEKSSTRTRISFCPRFQMETATWTPVTRRSPCPPLTVVAPSPRRHRPSTRATQATAATSMVGHTLSGQLVGICCCLCNGSG